MKKLDPVTGEEFECTADESCWCMKFPQKLTIKEAECIGPTRLKEEIQRHEHNDTDNEDVLDK